MVAQDFSLRIRCALIDDDPCYRALFKRNADKEGVHLDSFESLVDLGFVALLGRYDAIIVDYDLVGQTGLEIAQYLDSFFGNIPLILVSETTRSPGQKAWPKSIKSFVKKSEGIGCAIAAAKYYAPASFGC